MTSIKISCNIMDVHVYSTFTYQVVDFSWQAMDVIRRLRDLGVDKESLV